MRFTARFTRSAARPTASGRWRSPTGLGLDKKELLAAADSQQVTETMKNLVSLGTSLGLEATPSFIAGNLAILGYPGPHALQAVAGAVAQCGKAFC